MHIGGAEANVAVSLARFGHDAAVVSTVADNALGEAAVGELRRHGVDTRHVRAVPGRMGLYFLSHGALQRPSEVLYDRADSAFVRAAEDYDWDALLAGRGRGCTCRASARRWAPPPRRRPSTRRARRAGSG